MSTASASSPSVLQPQTNGRQFAATLIEKRKQQLARFRKQTNESKLSVQQMQDDWDKYNKPKKFLEFAKSPDVNDNRHSKDDVDSNDKFILATLVDAVKSTETHFMDMIVVILLLAVMIAIPWIPYDPYLVMLFYQLLVTVLLTIAVIKNFLQRYPVWRDNSILNGRPNWYAIWQTTGEVFPPKTPGWLATKGTISSYSSANGQQGAKYLMFFVLSVVFILCLNLIDNFRLVEDLNLGSEALLLMKLKFVFTGILAFIGFFPSAPTREDYLFFSPFRSKPIRILSLVAHMTSSIIGLGATLVCNFILIWKGLEKTDRQDAWVAMLVVSGFWVFILAFFVSLQAVYYVGQLRHLFKAKCCHSTYPGQKQERKIKILTQEMKSILEKCGNARAMEIANEFHDDGTCPVRGTWLFDHEDIVPDRFRVELQAKIIQRDILEHYLSVTAAIQTSQYVLDIKYRTSYQCVSIFFEAFLLWLLIGFEIALKIALLYFLL